MRGKLIFSVDLERMRKHKRDAYVWMGSLAVLSLCGLAYSLLDWESIVDNPGINAVGVVLLFIFSASSFLFLFIYLGLKPQAFIVYELGVSPPLKPWRALLLKEHFISHEEIRRVDVEAERLVLVDGSEISLYSWFLYNFLSSEKDVRRLKRLLKALHDFIEEMRKAEAEGKKADWVLKEEDVEF